MKQVKRLSFDNGQEIESWQLPFFEYRPTYKNDLHYCGCEGWE